MVIQSMQDHDQMEPAVVTPQFVACNHVSSGDYAVFTAKCACPAGLKPEEMAAEIAAQLNVMGLSAALIVGGCAVADVSYPAQVRKILRDRSGVNMLWVGYNPDSFQLAAKWFELPSLSPSFPWNLAEVLQFSSPVLELTAHKAETISEKVAQFEKLVEEYPIFFPVIKVDIILPNSLSDWLTEISDRTSRNTASQSVLMIDPAMDRAALVTGDRVSELHPKFWRKMGGADVNLKNVTEFLTGKNELKFEDEKLVVSFMPGQWVSKPHPKIDVTDIDMAFVQLVNRLSLAEFAEF